MQMPSEIKGRSVDEIITEWDRELEVRSRMFVKHAQSLAEWDKYILKNRHSLLSLEGELSRVVKGQEHLEKKLDILETHQNEIHNALLSMEGEADQLYREERPLYDEDTLQRDALYERAETLSSALCKIGDDLKGAIADVNDCAANSLPPEGTPMGSIIRILNNQLAALSQVDSRCAELSHELDHFNVNNGYGSTPGIGR